ncbi:GMC family oxidoreductase [Halomonas aquamarina]|uniref:GMC family oxidoreductase n=1 Tax=Vreelandella aquamarina TaxID=77097 RepID=A0ACC5VUY7_9GAMM|nr:GMC family oxidoreductase [Halomonas aquamarina]MBZ5487467.1 GMC family oxidoreductase [Halomonas aquamarina]
MASKRPKADVVIVGLGWSGALMAEELTRAGLNVVAIDRGAWQDTSTHTPPAVNPDELRWSSRKELLSPPKDNTMTFRNRLDQVAVPQRDYGILELGKGVGGAGFHWAGMAWRFNPWDFEVRTRTIERYGIERAEDGELQLQDWGVTYDELEPFYDRFERIAGISGTAGNINGEIKPGGNPYEGPRTREYPTPELKTLRMMEIFNDATRKMGHTPFTIPAANLSEPWVNPLGVAMGACSYCGFCLAYGCGNYSKSSPQACIFPALMRRPNFSVITEGCVIRVNKAEDGQTVTGVTYIDKGGREVEQPADIVCLTAFMVDNTRIMLNSEISEPYNPNTQEGVVGRNFSFQTISGAHMWFEDEQINPFVGAGALGSQIDDYNGDNFDHSDLDFIGGAGILTLSRDGLPIARAESLPEGTPRWGSDFKKAYAKYYQNYGILFNQGSSMPTRTGYLDLDPNYKDKFGVPLLRLTYDYAQNDRNMAAYTMDRAVEIAEQMGASHITPFNFAAEPFTTAKIASDHVIGGVPMGADPATSAVNPWLQSWDAHNLFVVGASAFPNNAGYNPTGTVGALAIRTARAIHERYVQNPGPLVES